MALLTANNDAQKCADAIAIFPSSFPFFADPFPSFFGPSGMGLGRVPVKYWTYFFGDGNVSWKDNWLRCFFDAVGMSIME